MAHADTAIIILNWNGKRYIKDCIDAVLRQSYTKWHIIFVDNASADGSADFVEREYARLLGRNLTVKRSRTNTGFAEGNNIGARNLPRGIKHIVLLNNDTIVSKTWLEELIAPLSDPLTGVVGSFSYDNPTRRAAVLRDYRRGGSTTMSLTGDAVKTGRAVTPIHETFYVGGYSLALRAQREDIFDQDYFAYAEDVYLCWLQRIEGKRVVLAMRSELVHYGSGTKDSDAAISKTAIFHGVKNQVMNYIIFYEAKNIIRIMPLFLLSQVGHVFEDPRKAGAKLRAYAWVITHLRSVLAKRRTVQRKRKADDREVISEMSCRLAEPEFFRRGWKRSVVKTINSIAYAYCFITGLRTVEFSK